jgi:hypothetical protein
MNQLLLKSGGTKYKYLSILASGHLIRHASSSLQSDNEIELNDVSIEGFPDKLRTLRLKRCEILATGELAWRPDGLPEEEE